MIKLKENYHKIFLDEFKTGEIHLNSSDNSLEVVWIPIEVFTSRYLNDSKYRYTREIANDNLSGIRFVFKDNTFAFSTRNGGISIYKNFINAFNVASSNLCPYNFNEQERFINVLEYFETLYYDYSEQINSISLFVEDVMSQFKDHMLEATDKLYKDIINCILEFGNTGKIISLFASIKNEFIEEYEDEPEFVDIENDYDILVEIIDEFFCNIEEEYDEIYLEKENGEEVLYSELIHTIFSDDPASALGRIEDILDQEYDGNVSLRDTMCIFDVLDSFINYSEDLLVDRIKELEREE